jgi:hypothetical protein
MVMKHVSRLLFVVSLVFAATAANAQSTEKTKPGTSIAGKASSSKATTSKATTERKRYEFADPAAAGATQTTGSSASNLAPTSEKEKSGCHSSASDA